MYWVTVKDANNIEGWSSRLDNCATLVICVTSFIKLYLGYIIFLYQCVTSYNIG
jgi:hypothetical protein